MRTYGNEKVRNLSFVLEPSVTVLSSAAVNITSCTVGDHAAEEDGVEPREGALESGDETPRNGEPNVSGVVDLAGKTVPSIDKDSSLRRDDSLGVVDGLPRNLGEGLAPDHLAALHGSEAVLLAVAAVPNPVPEQVCGVEQDKSKSVPSVLRRVMVCEEDGAVAV